MHLVTGDQFEKLKDDYLEKRKSGRKNKVEDDGDDDSSELAMSRKELNRSEKLVNRATAATTEKINRWSKKQLLSYFGIENLPEEMIDRYNA